MRTDMFCTFSLELATEHSHLKTSVWVFESDVLLVASWGRWLGGWVEMTKTKSLLIVKRLVRIKDSIYEATQVLFVKTIT